MPARGPGVYDLTRKKDNCDFPGSPLSGSSEGFGVSLFVGKLQYNVFIVRPSGSRRECATWPADKSTFSFWSFDSGNVR